MDQYATQMGQSSILGPSQDELRLQPHPQPQSRPQRVEPVHFDMYTHSYQYVAPGLAPTTYGMATTMFSAGMTQYGQPYFSQPQMVPGPSYGYYIPPYQSYGGYAPGPQAMDVVSSHYLSAPSTVHSLDGQHLEQGPLQQARVGKRKAVDSDDVGQETCTKRARIYHGIPPELQRIIKDGEVRYKCILPQCKEARAMKRGSVPRHINSNTHTGQDGLFPCIYCGKDLSRPDSLQRHVKACPKRKNFASVPQGPDDIAPASSVPQPSMPQVPFTFQTVWDPRSELTSATPASSESLEDYINSLEWDAAPGYLDQTNDSASGESLEDDSDGPVWDTDSGYETNDSASGKSLEDLLNDLDWTKVPGYLP